MSHQVANYVTLHKELLLLEREAEHAETTEASEGRKLSVLESNGVSLSPFAFSQYSRELY